MQYFDCEAESITYNIMGIATVNYTIISDSSTPTIFSTFAAGNQIFAGVVTNYVTQPIQKSEYGDTTWYTTNVILVATS